MATALLKRRLTQFYEIETSGLQLSRIATICVQDFGKMRERKMVEKEGLIETNDVKGNVGDRSIRNSENS
jgi:hypothetical protein